MLKLDQTILLIGLVLATFCKLIGGGITLYLNGVTNALTLYYFLKKQLF
jgi:hypothetical protein